MQALSQAGDGFTLWGSIRPGPARALVLAAVDVFAERGFHAATTRDIAARANMSPAGMYVHYRSKHAVLDAICRVGHTATLDLIRNEITRDRPSNREISQAIGTFAGWHASNSHVARVAQYQFGALEGASLTAIIDLRRATQAHLLDAIRRRPSRQPLDDDAARWLTRGLLSLAIDVCRWYEPAGRQTPAEVAAAYATLARSMLRG